MLGPHVFVVQLFLERELENLEAEELGNLLQVITGYDYHYREDEATKQHILTFNFKNGEIPRGKDLARSLKEKGFNIQTSVIL